MRRRLERPEQAARTPQDALPLVFVHARITAVGVDLAATEALRDAIVATIKSHAETWAARVKRRTVSPKAGAELFERYLGRPNVEIQR